MKLLLEMSSVRSAKQKYKENLDIVDYFTQKDLSSNKRYVLKMCDLFFDEGIDTEKIVHLFAAYEDNKGIFDSCGVDFNRYSYLELFNLVFRGTDEYENNMSLPNEIYKSENGIITVGIIKTFQEAMNLENKNSWCTSVSQGRFEENTSNGTMLYIIRDIEFSKASECRFVVCQLFINGEKIYWTSGNKQLTNKHNGSIPSINEYENVIGEALEYLKPSTQLTNESKLNKNMKAKKTITESQLRNIVAESIKKVLKESTLYGNTKPFEEIYRAATQIMDRYQYTQEDGYESMDDDGGDVCGGAWQWAKKVAEDAEYYLQCHSSYQPINGGEDW